MIRVRGLEPGRESSWIATANNDPFGLSSKFFVLSLDECSDISESFPGCQILQVASGPVFEWL